MSFKFRFSSRNVKNKSNKIDSQHFSTYNLKRPKSAGINIQRYINNDDVELRKNIHLLNNKNPSNCGASSSVEQYFERRHNDTVEKMNKIKIERDKNIESELIGRPKISKNSNEITKKMYSNNGQNVFDRLTNIGNVKKII